MRPDLSLYIYYLFNIDEHSHISLVYNRGRYEGSVIFYNIDLQDIKVPGGPYGTWLEHARKDST